jgi:hypothetical protein
MGEMNMLLVGALAGVVLALVLLGPALRPTILLSGGERGSEGGGCALIAGLLIFIALALAAGGA